MGRSFSRLVPAFFAVALIGPLVNPFPTYARTRVRASAAAKNSSGVVAGTAVQPFLPLGIAAEPNVPAQTIVAAVKAKWINVYDTPGATKARWVLNNATNFSGRHVFVVLANQGDWMKVEVPVRPNGTTGYVRTADVNLATHDFAIVVSLTGRRLTLYKGGQVVLQEKVGIGMNATPTPVGAFFLRELARTSNPGGAYGPYAFGLSAYSNVLQKFGRGDGQIGLHGTNQPGLLGTQVSHGCIRISNATITRLARTLPQGVPIDIRP